MKNFARIVGLAVACMAAAPVAAAPPHGRSHSSSGASFSNHHRASATVSRAPVASSVAVLAYAPYYARTASSLPQQPSLPRLVAAPSAYYYPGAAYAGGGYGTPDAEGWNWERVSFQNLVAEVKSRRQDNGAADEPRPGPYRQYCPDTRAYYPDVRECASDWLTVVANTTAGARPKNAGQAAPNRAPS